MLLPAAAIKAPFSRRHRAGMFNRLGLTPRFSEAPGGRVWIHCASVGEAAIPLHLVEILKQRFPRLNTVFSSCTDTGVERLEGLYPGESSFYLPFDFSFSVDKALRRVKPSVLVLVEQEIWPNLLLACCKKNVPVAIVNGRINEKSSRLVRTLFRLLPDAARAIKLCCVRSDADAQRFSYAGIDPGKIHSVGSLKYDALRTAISGSEQQRLCNLFGITGGDKILVGGSTHDGEELALLDVWKRLKAEHPRLRLVLAPRHVERADTIVRRLAREGVKVQRQSKAEAHGGDMVLEPDTVILVDVIGRLRTWYALADVVFVGRSLQPPGGGQNMMEPAALGKPVIVGPYTGNFKPEMEVLKADNAVICVDDVVGLQQEAARLLTDRGYAEWLGDSAKNVIERNRGAANVTADLLQPLILEKNTKNGII